MSMANALKKPLILLPIICTAACCGVLAALWDIQGSPMSAGFGFSGLIGPINYMNFTRRWLDICYFVKIYYRFCRCSNCF